MKLTSLSHCGFAVGSRGAQFRTDSDKKEQQCTFEMLLPTGPMLLISAFNTDKK